MSADLAGRIRSSHQPMNQRPSTLQKSIDSRRLSQARNTQKKKVHATYERCVRVLCNNEALAHLFYVRLSLGLAKSYCHHARVRR